MKKEKILLALIVIIVLSAGGYGVYLIGIQQGMSISADAIKSTDGQAQDLQPKSGRKILYYHDPMVPGHKFDKPRQVAFHGHAIGAGVCRRRWRPGQGQH